MKKIIFTLLLLSSYQIGISQQKYDDGPITGGSNFAVRGTWGRNNITFSFLNGTTDIANDDERNAVRQAFQLWADYANLNFTEVATNGDIRVSWQVGNHGDGSPFDGLNGVLAHAFFPPAAGGTTAFAGDIHFDGAETWTMLERPVLSGQPLDLVTVAAHEIGHALGLEHSNVPCALMNAFYNGSHRYLAQDDIDGIQSIYGNRPAIRSNNVTCSGGTLFINNLPTGATTSWTSANTSIATVANINNQGIVARVGSANGTVRITCIITLPCGATVTEFLDMAVGSPKPAYGIYPVDYPAQYCRETYGFELLDPQGDPLGFTWIIYGPSTTTYYHNQGDQVQLTFTETGTNTIACIASNSCGGAPAVTTSVEVVFCGWGFRASPNPANGSVNVALDEQTVKNDKTINIREIQITDKLGNVVKQFKYNTTIKLATLNISTLKPDLYYIRVFNGKEWKSKAIIKQ